MQATYVLAANRFCYSLLLREIFEDPSKVGQITDHKLRPFCTHNL